MVRIYIDKQCGYCKKLKEGLNKYNIKFTEVDVDLPSNERETNKIFELAGERVIPIITIKPHLLVPKKSFNTIDEAIGIIRNLTE